MRSCSTSRALAALHLLPIAAAAQCPTFGAFAATGPLPANLSPSGTLSEVSGMVASRRQPGVLWLHDDSGHGPIFVGLRANGALVQQYAIPSVSPVDWEDVALGPGPQIGRDYLYFADTGNNSTPRTVFAIVRVAEPDVPASPGPQTSAGNAEVFRFQYPGAAQNAEALLIDPVDGTPWIVSKDAGQAVLYRYSLPLDAGTTRTLVQVATLALPMYTVTGADITADGSRIFLRSNQQVLAFPRPRGTTVAAAMGTPPCVVFTGSQGQVESIAIEPDGSGIYTVAEGAGNPILRAPALVVPVHPAWWTYGAGVRGVLGLPGVGPDAAPVLGMPSPNLAIYAGNPLAGALCALSVTAFPDGTRPFVGGYLLVDPQLVVGTSLDAGGASAIPLPPLPPDPTFAGFRVHAQAFVLDPSIAGGVSMTRGLTLRLGF